MHDPRVHIFRLAAAAYPTTAPFNPSIAYPEYPFPGEIGTQENHVYDGVRQLLRGLGYDANRFDTPVWNPLCDLIRPGMTVVIKPNFVLSRHPEGKDLFSIITHPSVIRATADYCWIALHGAGRIIIADAPQYNCNFEELLEATHLNKVRNLYRRFPGPQVDIYDLRTYWSASLHMPSCIRRLAGDPRGSVRVDLGKGSVFVSHPHPERFYGAVYHRQETIQNHTNDRQEYEVSGTVLSADVLISVPKLKVHKKVGVTLNGKGLVGTCTNKNLLVHYSLGTPKDGGDQFPDGLLTPKEEGIIRFERWMYDNFLARRSVGYECIHRFLYGFLYLKILRHLGLSIPKDKRLLDAGNWYGNDSAWRMVVDLMKILHHTDARGKLCTSLSPRRTFSIIDGIIGGENKGPLAPDPKHSGVLIGGEHLLAVDIVGTRLMGFDPLKLKQITAFVGRGALLGLNSVTDIPVTSNDPAFANCLSDPGNNFLAFNPYPGWRGHIELSNNHWGAT